MLKDKRSFTRHELRYDFQLPIQGKPFHATLLDYAFDGIKLGIRGVPPLKLGDTLMVELPEHKKLSGAGKVVWIRRGPDGLLLAGIRKQGVLQGSLKYYNFADVMLGLQRRGLTGVLNVTSGPIQKSVFFENSDIVHATSNAQQDRLLDMLLEWGRIDRPRYMRANDAVINMRKRPQAVLVEMRVMDSTEADAVVLANIESIITGLFGLEEADFNYRDGNVPMGRAEGLSLQIGNITRVGIRRITDTGRLSSLCPPPDSVLIISTEPLNLFQAVVLGDDERALLTLIDGRRTMQEVMAASPLGELRTYQTVYALLSTRTIDHIGAGEQFDRHYTPTIEDIVVGQPYQVDPSAFMPELEFMCANLGSLGYYGALGVQRDATPAEIERAYYLKGKAFHPDRHFYLPPDARKKLESVFNFLTKSYSTLMDQEARREYDGSTSAAGSGDVYKADAKFVEGEANWKKGRQAEAADCFKEAVALNDAVVKYHYAYGLSLTRLGRHKEAERALQRAIALDPANPDYQAEIGHVYVALGMPLRAKVSFERALKLQTLHLRAVQGMKLIK